LEAWGKGGRFLQFLIKITHLYVIVYSAKIIILKQLTHKLKAFEKQSKRTAVNRINKVQTL